MNTYNFNDEVFQKTASYQNFINNNQSYGYLKVRASTASEALPISDLKVTISKIIDNNNVIFFEGTTNKSGIIDKIELPAPKQNQNDLIAPASITYNIYAIYEPNNFSETYRVNIYENIYVIQNINIVPTMSATAGDN